MPYRPQPLLPRLLEQRHHRYPNRVTDNDQLVISSRATGKDSVDLLARRVEAGQARRPDTANTPVAWLLTVSSSSNAPMTASMHR